MGMEIIRLDDGDFRNHTKYAQCLVFVQQRLPASGTLQYADADSTDVLCCKRADYPEG